MHGHSPTLLSSIGGRPNLPAATSLRLTARTAEAPVRTCRGRPQGCGDSHIVGHAAAAHINAASMAGSEARLAMSMEESQIQRAEDAALDHQIIVEEVTRDRVVTVTEQQRLLCSARRLHRAIRRAHFIQRAGASVTRRGVIAPRLYVEFADVAALHPGTGEDDDEAA